MAEKRKKKKGSGLSGLEPYYIIIGSIIILLIAVLLLLKNFGTGGGPAERPADSAPAQTAEAEERPGTPAGGGQNVPAAAEHPSAPKEKPAGGAYRAAPAAPPQRPLVEHRGDLVYVIDDVGNSLAQLEYFLKVPHPVTFAIMPDRKFSEECAARITAAGKSYILHQPMEAVSGQDPGLSAIYTGMSRDEIFSILDHNFGQLPAAGGMNNHMGSKATSDPEVMDAVMEYLAENNLFFLDSYTISGSLGYEAAKKHNVSYLRRNSMFLDNEKDHESIQAAINEGKRKAASGGHAVMIGHIMTGELADTMMELYPNFIEDGFSLKEISEIFIEMNKIGSGAE